MSGKRTRISDDFIVSGRIIELAKANGWPDPRRELDAFKDYHLAHGSLMMDWEAAFRTWLRKAKEWQMRRAPLTPEPKPIRRREDRPQDGAGKYDPRVQGLLGDLVKKFSGH